MTFSRPDADLFTPDGSDPAAALARTTHLCIAAHQDDIEIMAHAGIAACLGDPALHFTGVVATDGAGSSRTGRYRGMSDADLRAVRREEQRRAAALGRYNLQVQLVHPSAAVKQPRDAGVAADLALILAAASPAVVYLHNLADKHDTHVALALRCIAALRALPRDRRPGRVLGCEVWRDLDWMLDADRVALDAGAQPELAGALLRVFDSQVGGGKRYDLATLGRRAANATFNDARAADSSSAITWAMDLTPLVRDENLPIEPYVTAYVDRLKADIADRIKRFAS